MLQEIANYSHHPVSIPLKSTLRELQYAEEVPPDRSVDNSAITHIFHKFDDSLSKNLDNSQGNEVKQLL